MSVEGIKNKFALNNANADGADRSRNSGEAGEVIAGPDEHDLMISSSPCSSVDSLSENLNIVTNDFVSEAPTNASKQSSEIDGWQSHRQFRVPADKIAYANDDNESRKSPKQKTHFGRLKRSMRKRARRAFAVGGSSGSITLPSQKCHSGFPQARVRPIVPPEYILPSIFRRFSRHGPLFSRESFTGTFGILNRGAHNSEIFSGTSDNNDKIHAFCTSGTKRCSRHRHSEDDGAVIAVRPPVFRAYGCARHVFISAKDRHSRCRAFSVDLLAKCIANSLASEDDCVRESTHLSSRQKCRTNENGRQRSVRAASGDIKRIHASNCYGGNEDFLKIARDNSSSQTVNDTSRITAPFSPLLEEDFDDEEGPSAITTAKFPQTIPKPAYYGINASQQNERESSLVKFKFSDSKSNAPEPLLSHSPIKCDSSAVEFLSDCFAKNSMETSTTEIRSTISSNIFSDVSFNKPLLEHDVNVALSENIKGATFVNRNTIDMTKSIDITGSHGHRQGGHYHYSNHCSAPTLRRSFESMINGSDRVNCRHCFFERNHSSSRLESGCAYAAASANVNAIVTAKGNDNADAKALAVKTAKKAVNRKESSLKRKVTKSQRKEKRATKTLGIVVGIFLVCWVPFFTINILNAVCVTVRVSACEIGFAPFFYATWIGYMNSFMNPIIYTIFNTEFRRAFKSLILGRKAMKRHINRERKM